MIGAPSERRFVKTSVESFGRGFGILASLLFLILSVAAPAHAQSKLSLQEAVNKAFQSRASLKAEAERVSIAQGFEKQAELIANPVLQFENQNLRPGQTYTRDVDIFAYLTQPLDVLGKRKQRILLAKDGVSRTQTGYELTRLQIVL